MILLIKADTYARTTVAHVLIVLSVIFVGSASAGSASAQNQCVQTSRNIPAASELLGFRLGMTKDDVKALVPQIVFRRADEFGVTKTTINPYFDSRMDQNRFAGVRSISLDFADDRLMSLWIGYDDNFKVKTVDEFVRLITESWHLTGPWSSWKSRGQQLRCGDFEVIVATVAGTPSVHLLDSAAEDTIAARRQAKEERDSAVETSAQIPVETQIIGDKHDKVFYPSGCQAAKEISDSNRITFRSIADAERAGFKLGKNCR